MIQLDPSVYRRYPALKHESTRAHHGEQLAVPGGLGRVAGHGAVWAVIVNELFKVGEEVHWLHEMSSSVSITAQPSFLKEGSTARERGPGPAGRGVGTLPEDSEIRRATDGQSLAGRTRTLKRTCALSGIRPAAHPSGISG